MRGRHALFAAGAVLIGIGFAGLLGSGVRPVGWAIWFAGAAIAHDALLAPAVFGAAHLVGRAPRQVRAPLTIALVLAGSVTLVALPLLWEEGRRPDNPSILPQAYGVHLSTIVILIALVTAAIAALNAYAHRMGKAILTIIGVLLSIWLLFTVISMVVATLKFLLWIGLLAVLAAIVVTIIGKMAKS
jgi:hypothetical protein